MDAGVKHDSALVGVPASAGCVVVEGALVVDRIEVEGLGVVGSALVLTETVRLEVRHHGERAQGRSIRIAVVSCWLGDGGGRYTERDVDLSSG